MRFPEEVFDGSARLTHAVPQEAEMLGMYRAELARILKQQCGEIDLLVLIKKML
jgi:hypothetical protein